MEFTFSYAMQHIADLSDLVSKHRCLQAYNYLMSKTQSSCKHFVEQRDLNVNTGKRFNKYDGNESCYVECSLWPNREYCDTGIPGQSMKKFSAMAPIMTSFISIMISGYLKQ